MEFILNRLKEQTTWYGILLLATSFGLDLTNAQQNAIMFFGMAMCAAPDINMQALKDKLNINKPPQ